MYRQSRLVKKRFFSENKKIEIEDGAWIGAKSILGPGVIVERGAVLALGSVASKRMHSNKIYLGNPAVFIKERSIYD